MDKLFVTVVKTWDPRPMLEQVFAGDMRLLCFVALKQVDEHRELMLFLPQSLQNDDVRQLLERICEELG